MGALGPGTFVALALALAAPPPAAPAPEPARKVESWTCTVSEQLDVHVSGMAQMMVDPDRRRRELSFYVNWSEQPHYMALQQMRWISIPLDATRLWKPDDIALAIDGEKTDEQGSLYFRFEAHAPFSESAAGKVKSLGNFKRKWVTLVDAYLRARLWANWPWSVEHDDRNGLSLGKQAILLPGPDVSQAMFERLRGRLDAAAREPAKNCTANLEPDEFDRMLQTV
jgi:hypothetical protein